MSYYQDLDDGLGFPHIEPEQLNDLDPHARWVGSKPAVERSVVSGNRRDREWFETDYINTDEDLERNDD